MGWKQKEKYLLGHSLALVNIELVEHWVQLIVELQLDRVVK